MRHPISLLSALLFPALLSAQTAAVTPPPKDPGLAGVLGLVLPGAGHVYAERMGPAVLTWAAMGVALGYGYAQRTEAQYGFEIDVINGEFVTRRPLLKAANNTPLQLGMMVAGAAWIASAVTSPGSAKKTNQERAQRLSFVPSPTRVAVQVKF